MGIREKLNDNPRVTTGITAAIVVIALAFIIYQLLPNRGPRIPTERFYSDDDGATWFADDINKIPPFDHNGKQAVRANVYQCGSGKPFVAYLEKYDDKAKAKLEELQAKMKEVGNNPPGPGQVPPGADFEEVSMTGIMVKKPGGGNWVRQMDYQHSQEVTTIKCPDGKVDDLRPVTP